MPIFFERFENDNEIQDRFNNVVQFLLENHHYNENYQQFHLEKTLSPYDTPKTRLTAVFINAMLSNRSNMDMDATAIIEFKNRIEGLNNNFLLADFLNLIVDDNAEPTIINAYNYLRNNRDFNGVGPKKAALFFRDLYIVQEINNNEINIFNDNLINKDDLIIPVDRVIATTINYIFDIEDPIFINEDPNHRFDDLNIDSVNLYPDNHMIIEELWFWGFFSFTGGGIIGRAPIVNNSKIHSDLTLLRLFENEEITFNNLVDDCNEFLMIIGANG